MTNNNTHNHQPGELPKKEGWRERLLAQLISGMRVLVRDSGNNKISSEIEAFIASVEEEARRGAITEDTSDGFHTFKELYEFRKLYNAALFNEWAAQGKYNVHKSYKHADGENCFGGGWFIVMATLPTGQISNHYDNRDWELFKCEERPTAEQWDGHTAQDVLTRLAALQSH